jgi:hypothetical protein
MPKWRIRNGLIKRLGHRIVPNSRAVYDSFTAYERLLVDNDQVRAFPTGWI